MGGESVTYQDPDSLEGLRDLDSTRGILWLFSSLKMSVQGYHFKLEPWIPKLIEEVKTPEDLESEWKEFIENTKQSMTPVQQYEACLDLVAELRYAAYSKLGELLKGKWTNNISPCRKGRCTIW